MQARRGGNARLDKQAGYAQPDQVARFAFTVVGCLGIEKMLMPDLAQGLPLAANHRVSFRSRAL